MRRPLWRRRLPPSQRGINTDAQASVAALNTLREAAARAGRTEIVAFAEELVEHARTEEEVMYPAAVLVGQVVRERLGQRSAPTKRRSSAL